MPTGVKYLLRAQPVRGVPGQAHLDVLNRLVDDICATALSSRAEAGVVTCQLMKQGQGVVGTMGGPAAAGGGGGLKDMWAVSFEDAPEQVYLLVRPEHKAIECDASMVRLMEKKLEYGKQMTVRLKGSSFNKGDFHLRLCTVTQAIHATQALLGYCLEVEYLPCSTPAAAEGMMAEFVLLLRQQLAASSGGGPNALQLELVRPSYDKYGLGPTGGHFGRLHTAVAYGELVVGMLASSAAATGAGGGGAQPGAAGAGPR